nr:MAG TPA: hypothetical protein [Crassvirales sp.]
MRLIFDSLIINAITLRTFVSTYHPRFCTRTELLPR